MPDISTISTHQTPAPQGAICGTSAVGHACTRSTPLSTWLPVFGLAALFAGQAFADQRNLSGSMVTMQDTDKPGAVAEVEFSNLPNNSERDNGTFEMTHNGITVAVTFTWNAFGSPDQIEVTAPEGYVAIPPVIEVSERGVGTIYLFSGQPGV